MNLAAAIYLLLAVLMFVGAYAHLTSEYRRLAGRLVGASVWALAALVQIALAFENWT